VLFARVPCYFSLIASIELATPYLGAAIDYCGGQIYPPPAKFSARPRPAPLMKKQIFMAWELLR
jgi:hypothetical protein